MDLNIWFELNDCVSLTSFVGAENLVRLGLSRFGEINTTPIYHKFDLFIFYFFLTRIVRSISYFSSPMYVKILF